MLLTRSTDAPPFLSDHFVTGVWDGGQWAMNLGLAVLWLVMLGAVAPMVVGWIREAWDEMATWLQVVAVVAMVALIATALWAFGDQIFEILNHLPANSFRGKLWKVVGVVLVAAAAQAWALWRIWSRLFDGGTESRVDLVPIALGVATPAIVGAWVLLATIPVVFGFTVFGVLAVAVVVALIVLADQR